MFYDTDKAVQLYRTFVDLGFIEEGQDITPAQRNVLFEYLKQNHDAVVALAKESEQSEE